MHKWFQVLLVLSIFFCLGCRNSQSEHKVNVIPLPAKVSFTKGNFKIDSHTKLIYQNEELEVLANYAVGLWEPISGFRPATSQMKELKGNNSIILKISETQQDEIADEGYILEISSKQVILSANTKAGIIYGIQTISQMLSGAGQSTLPSCKIIDYPRFPYRGMHLDVSRHFMPLEFIYKLMDYLVMHKINIFHWHLVDDQGWRLEIKKYPKLTEIGAWRNDLEHKHWDDRPLTNDRTNATYGGFYTQEEVSALVKYAVKRNITIIPEIEMPAHVMSALAAYPEFSCTGQNLGVPSGGVWPITHIYCAGNDSTFVFLEEVLTEVMGLFPSTFIHIGGDEADKSNWRSCPKCQARIRNEKLANENELQSYFIQRIERFLNANGRKLIGWDEILEGGLAPNATVMSWRGEHGGIEAAKLGNTVIMTPGSHCYFDHHQGDPSPESLAIGGFTTLSKVYGYEPVPAALTQEQGKLVLGAQANVWTEFMPTTQQVEYMVFPRIAALAEVLWSPKERRNWMDFSNRMNSQYQRYEKLGINYSRSAFSVNVLPEVNPHNRSLRLSLHTEAIDPVIRYTLDGSMPDRQSMVYHAPFEIKESTRLIAAVFSGEGKREQMLNRSFDIHKAFACNLTLKHANNPKYDGQGEFTLVNGIRGSNHFGDGNWLGFLGDHMTATVELPESTNLFEITADALQNYTAWIFYPERVVFEVSEDGKNFGTIGEVVNEVPVDEKGKLIQLFSVQQEVKNIRFIRVHMFNLGTCPPGHNGEGQPSWIFVSEITVR